MGTVPKAAVISLTVGNDWNLGRLDCPHRARRGPCLPAPSLPSLSLGLSSLRTWNSRVLMGQLRLLAIMQPGRSQGRLWTVWPWGHLELELGLGFLGGCLGHCIFCAFSPCGPPPPTHCLRL